MQSKLKCPFCKMHLTEFIPGKGYSCTRDGLMVDLNGRGAYFTDTAPLHLKESYEFINQFRITDPMFVMSPVPLWSEDFRLSDCDFIGCSTESKDVRCLTIDKVNISKSILSKRLIAGRRLLADELLTLFRGAIENQAADNPLVRYDGTQPEKWLWVKIILNSQETKIVHHDSFFLSQIYFQPSLEGMIHELFNLFNHPMAQPLDNEQALYSAILCMPQINISWGRGPVDLKRCLISYVNACLKDIESVEYVDEEDNPNSIISRMPDNWSSSFKKFYKLSQPSLALNNYDDNSSSFDILNHTFQRDYASEYAVDNFSNKDIITLTNTYRVLGELWNKYAYWQRYYGLQTKRCYMSPVKVPPNEVFSEKENDLFLLQFWQEVKKAVERESTR